MIVLIPKKTNGFFSLISLFRLFTVFVLGVYIAVGQESISKDSLQKLSYDELYTAYRNANGDTLISKLYLSTYLEKAMVDKDTIKMAEAYSSLSYYAAEESEKIALLDLAIAITKRLDNDRYPIKAYSFKGGYYFTKGDYQRALDNYILALALSEQVQNTEYVQSTNHNIACIKTKIDKHEEALTLFKENFEYESDREELNAMSYLLSLIPMAESYRYNKLLDSASFYNHKGIVMSLKSKKLKHHFYGKLVLNEGVNLFFKEHFDHAYDSINKGIRLLKEEQIKDNESYVLGSFYLGQLYLKKEDTLRAEKEFLHMDALIQKDNIILPETRKGYEFLIAWYKTNSEQEKQLTYINRLLQFDRVIGSQRASVSTKLFKEFDTPLLLKEKEDVITKLEENASTLSFWVIILILLSLMATGFTYYQFVKRKKYQQKFNELLTQGNKREESSKKMTNDDIGIADEVVNDILSKLDQFEGERQFLQKNISISSLAKEINTNTKYLSKVINYHKNKSFTNYVNELRVQYSVEQLKENASLKNYTIQGIAEEMGFNSAESFSAAFKKSTGIKPSYFMRKLTSLPIE